MRFKIKTILLFLNKSYVVGLSVKSTLHGYFRMQGCTSMFFFHFHKGKQLL